MDKVEPLAESGSWEFLVVEALELFFQFQITTASYASSHPSPLRGGWGGVMFLHVILPTRVILRLDPLDGIVERFDYPERNVLITI